MKVYKLPYVIIPPLTDWNDEEDKYVAEIPLLPGCRAWGDTPEQAVEFLQSVAEAYIASSRKRGWPLPSDVESTAVEIRESEDQVLVTV